MVTLTPDEIRELTQLVQPAAQLRELRRQGFWRARRGAHGAVILERAHYEAVSRGEDQARPAPKLRPPNLRSVR